MIKIFFLFSICLAISSCTDLFSTREGKVEKPNPNSGIFDTALDTDTVLRNFSLAIQSRNIEEYKKIFSNPLADESNAPPFLFYGNGSFNVQVLDGRWDYQDEINFAEDLFAKESIKSIQFSYSDSIPRPTPIDENFEETNFFRYNLILDYYSSPAKKFRGQAQFKLFRSTSNAELWYIYEWHDESSGSDSTFSLLKLEGPI